MAAPYNDRPYRLPNFGVDGAIPEEDWWKVPRELPNISPRLPWWISPPPKDELFPPMLPGPRSRPPWWIDPQAPTVQPPPQPPGSQLLSPPQTLPLADFSQAESARRSLGMTDEKGRRGKRRPVDEANAARESLVGLVSGEPMQHWMIPIFDTRR